MLDPTTRCSGIVAGGGATPWSFRTGVGAGGMQSKFKV